VVFNIRQQPWRFVTRRLDDVALELRQDTCQKGIPGVLITCLCGVLYKDIVTHRLYPHQAQTACKGFILG
jgi:hypothetical protein